MSNIQVLSLSQVAYEFTPTTLFKWPARSPYPRLTISECACIKLLRIYSVQAVQSMINVATSYGTMEIIRQESSMLEEQEEEEGTRFWNKSLSVTIFGRRRKVEKLNMEARAWRELYAIDFALKSFDAALSNSYV